MARNQQADEIALDPPLDSAADGREIVYWLANACRRLREEAGVRREVVAGLANIGEWTVRRFEQVKTLPENLDALVAVYGQVAGFADNREVYAEMLDLWMEMGAPHAPPSPDGLARPEMRAIAAAAEARQRDEARSRRRARRERAAEPTAKTTGRRARG